MTDRLAEVEGDLKDHFLKVVTDFKVFKFFDQVFVVFKGLFKGGLSDIFRSFSVKF